jgi:DNA-binding HxlR family transcriptional regulator
LLSARHAAPEWEGCHVHFNLHDDSNHPIFAAMQRKSFSQMSCPIARSLERVGEWWSMLIMRDALHGLSRFDEFQDSLGIAPNMLTRRLNALVEAGLLERHRYSERPLRHEYRPTALGRDFRPVLTALLAWGNRNFAPEGPSVVIVNTRTGAQADPILVDRATGQPICEPDYRSAPGPAAGESTRRRYARRDEAPRAVHLGRRRRNP